MLDLLVLALLVLLVWRTWPPRQTPRPRVPTPPGETATVDGFRGAVPPNRFVVVRWPQGRLEYQGCIGGRAREVYEHTHPAKGEVVEFWELGTRRGHKEA